MRQIVVREYSLTRDLAWLKSIVDEKNIELSMKQHFDSCRRSIGKKFCLCRADAYKKLHLVGVQDFCTGVIELTSWQEGWLYETDLLFALTEATDVVPTFLTLPERVRAALVELIFVLGSVSIELNTRLLIAIESHNYVLASRIIENDYPHCTWISEQLRSWHAEGNTCCL